ncbi:MFS transporter [Candidatus Uhrbacteria bacterium]|nr:MFS transporter [Candidatus Uhrbacteria bacterium]
MTHQQRVARNPRLLFWARAFIEIKALSAVIVLFYLHRGLVLDQIFWLSIVWSLTALVTEIPSGYLADRIGRKATLLIGAGLLALVHVGDWFAHGFWQFSLVFVLMSAAFSFFSGTEEAMLYESLLELGKERDTTQKSSHLFCARSLFKIAMPFIGVWVAQDLLEWQFRILISMNALALFLACLCLVQLREPRHRIDISEMEIGIFQQSLQTIAHHPWLIRLCLNRLLVFVGVFIAWRISQPLLMSEGLSVGWLGVFDAGGYLFLFLGSWLVGKTAHRWRVSKVIFLTALLTSGCLAIAAVSHIPWILFIALWSAIAVGSVREPLFSQMVNARVQSRSRATTLSNLNVLKSLMDIPVLLFTGYLAMQDLHYPLIMSFFLCLSAIIFFPVRENQPVFRVETS